MSAPPFVLRLSTMPIDDGIFAGDGVHPNNVGHGRIADLFWAVIEPALRSQVTYRPATGVQVLSGSNAPSS